MNYCFCKTVTLHVKIRNTFCRRTFGKKYLHKERAKQMALVPSSRRILKMEGKGQVGEVEKITCREVLRLVLFFCFIVAFFFPFIFRFSYFFLF